MIIKYYTQENDISSIVDYFKTRLSMKDTIQDNLIKAKIKNLYDHNFLKLFKQVHTFLPIIDMKNEELYFFFNEKVYNFFDYENFILEDKDEDEDVYSPFFPMHYAKLNCKLKIYTVLEKILNAKKIPLRAVITELLTLKDFIINEILSNLDYVLNSNDEYLNHMLEDIELDYFFFSIKIKEAINDHKYNLTNYLDLITLKLEEISSKTNIINITNENNKFITNYDLSIDDKILYQLYRELERNEFIDPIETSNNQFVEVLKKDWNCHESIIHFKMDNIQLNFFLINLKKYLNIKLSLTKIEYANNIYNKNGKPKAYSVSSSYSESTRKGTEPKRKKDIISIFEKLK